MTQDSPTNDQDPKPKDDQPSHANREERYERGTAYDVFSSHQEQVEKHSNNDIANNDGSILATLDTTLHGTARSDSHHGAEGSNRTDYYERDETHSSDVEEELDALDKKPKD